MDEQEFLSRAFRDWDAPATYARLAGAFVFCALTTCIGGWFQVAALRPEFPTIRVGHWIVVSGPVLVGVDMVQIAAFENRSMDWTEILLDATQVLIAAGLVWRFILADKATGVRSWLCWFAASGLVTSLLLEMCEVFSLADPMITGALRVAIYMILPPAISGIGVMNLRIRSRSLGHVFA